MKIEIIAECSGRTSRWRFEGTNRITIGRDPDNLLVLDDSAVAPHHAELWVEPGRLELSDLRGGDGPRPIAAGRAVQIGPLVLTVSAADDALTQRIDSDETLTQRIDSDETLTQRIARDEAAATQPYQRLRGSTEAAGVALGRYRLLERVGLGGMAEVFAAEEGESGRLVAVKRMLPPLAADEAMVAMFVDEGRIAAAVGHDHPNICAVYECGSADGTHYIAMELIDGITLGELQQRQPGPFPPPVAAYVLGELCNGLAHVHGCCDHEGRPLEIVHRGLSPADVMIDREAAVKLIDFGIARAEGRQSGTEPGVLKGRFRYMAPEQVCGEPFDHRVDLFVAGVLLYELVTGRAAFEGRTDFEVLERVRNVQLVPPRERLPELSAELERVILRALQRDPDRRYASASALRSALLRAVPDDPLPSRGWLAQQISSAPRPY